MVAVTVEVDGGAGMACGARCVGVYVRVEPDGGSGRAVDNVDCYTKVRGWVGSGWCAEKMGARGVACAWMCVEWRWVRGSGSC